MADFECWLSDRLNALKFDAEVFSSYIQGILEGDEKHDEKVEAIEGILESASTETSDVHEITEEIIREFNKQSGVGDLTGATLSSKATSDETQPDSFKDKVRTIFSQQTTKAMESAQKKKAVASEETAKLRSSILNQYAEVEIAEKKLPEADTTKTSADLTQTVPSVLGLKTEKRKTLQSDNDNLLMKNTNAQQVLEAEKLKREKNKQESEAKKAKDKLDRETQKKKEVDRREKEKQRTQKGERRR